MTSAEDERDSLEESLFTTEDPVFAHKELLTVGHVPDIDRIVGRDAEMQHIANALNPAIFAQSPINALIYGKTGTGKSLCARQVTKRCTRLAVERGVRMAVAYVDCSQQKTETQAVWSAATQLNDSDETDVVVPETGLGTAQYYNRLWSIVDELYDVVVIVLDEIDRQPDDEVLLQLSRAEEAGKVATCNIGVMGISNKINYKKTMDERVKSSLQEREFVFPPYDATQLRDIIDKRRDAFKTGVLSDGAVSLTAALAAQEHGDARKAIDILRHAGELALEEGDDRVRERHVRNAQELAERDRFRELISGVPVQTKAALLALAQLSTHSKRQSFRTSAVYDEYEQLCRDVGIKILTERRIYDLLKELSFLGVNEMNRTGGGRGEGQYTEHHLVESPTAVKAVIQEDSLFDELTYRDRTDFKLW